MRVSGKPKTVDMTPTWSDILPLMLAGLNNSTQQGHGAIEQQFGQMAEAADKWNAHCRRMKEGK
tara:strand:+ start:289 stop:480 length:192 start_codon:yes stop_codon:yes gene_type:complete